MYYARIGLTLALLLAACGGSSSDPGAQPPAPPGDPPGVTPTTTTARTMGTARTMATRPDNLLYDPTFASLSAQYSYNVYPVEANLTLDVPATSPAGPATAVLIATPTGSASVLLMGQGGSGALDAKVFVAVAEGQALPDIALMSLTQQDTWYELAATPEADQKHGDRTWHAFAAHVPDAVLGGVALMIQPKDDKPVAIAAPELVSSTGLPTMSLRAHGTRAPGKAIRAATLAAARPVVPVRPEAALPRLRVELRGGAAR